MSDSSSSTTSASASASDTAIMPKPIHKVIKKIPKPVIVKKIPVKAVEAVLPTVKPIVTQTQVTATIATAEIDTINTCQICTNKFSNIKRKATCAFCSYEACNICWQTYILGQSQPKCMAPQCGKPFTRQWMAANLTSTFMTKDLKKHNENRIYDIEKTLLPSTQPIVEELKRREQLIKTTAQKIREEREAFEKIKEAYEAKNTQLQRTILQNQPDIERIVITMERRARGETGEPVTEKQKKYQLNHKCPVDNCRGFLDHKWFCSLCETKICAQCNHPKKNTDIDEDEDEDVATASASASANEPITEPTVNENNGRTRHVCDENEKATFKLLKRDTKSCPKCAVPIHKINGCDHMWCSQCHTSFSWITGAIMQKTSNPHYFEWLRNNNHTIPREPGDIIGGGGPGGPGGDCNIPTELDNRLMSNINDKLMWILDKYKITSTNITNKHIWNKFDEFKTIVNETIRFALHIQATEVTRLNAIFNDPRYLERINRNLRVDYLSNKINETIFKHKLQIANKAHEKNRERFDTFQLFFQTITDIMIRYYVFLNGLVESIKENQKKGFRVKNDFIKEKEDVIKQVTEYTLLNEIMGITEYSNECLSNISKTYGSVKHTIALYTVRTKYILNAQKEQKKIKTKLFYPMLLDLSSYRDQAFIDFSNIAEPVIEIGIGIHDINTVRAFMGAGGPL